MINKEKVLPFVWVALAWLAVGLILCYFLAFQAPIGLVFGWFFLLWAICLVDFLSMVISFSKFLDLKAGSIRIRQFFEAAFWGAVKLVCLGLFGIVLLKGRSIPTVGLLAGFGTLFIVPLVGGFWWSFKEFLHA
jgi:hypothetical protein